MNNVKGRYSSFSYEGSPYSKIWRLIEEVGYNDGGNVVRAEVTGEYPDFKIKLDGEDIEIPSDGIVCNPDLFPRTETVKIDGKTCVIEYPKKLVKGAKVFVFEPEHGQLVYVLCMGE